jgi:hypothetical protein
VENADLIYIEIHKVKELMLEMNLLAQKILSIPKQKDMLNHIDKMKGILESSNIKEETHG